MNPRPPCFICPHLPHRPSLPTARQGVCISGSIQCFDRRSQVRGIRWRGSRLAPGGRADCWPPRTQADGSARAHSRLPGPRADVSASPAAPGQVTARLRKPSRVMQPPGWVTKMLLSLGHPGGPVLPGGNGLFPRPRVRLDRLTVAALRPSAEREAGGGVLRGARLVGPAAARREAGQGVRFAFGLGRRDVRDGLTGAVRVPVFTLSAGVRCKR